MLSVIICLHIRSQLSLLVQTGTKLSCSDFYYLVSSRGGGGGSEQEQVPHPTPLTPLSLIVDFLRLSTDSAGSAGQMLEENHFFVIDDETISNPHLLFFLPLPPSLL